MLAVHDAEPGDSISDFMDNLAHTLVSAALGRAIADHKIPHAALLGVIAGNAPDWMEILVTPRAAVPRSGVTYLVYHRGITHSLLGAAIEIAVLSAGAGLLAAWGARRKGQNPPPWRWTAACVAATVASHVYLDWQGSYGLRPFLPWSGRWFYADWIAIVDPFFWILPLVALAWGARRHWRPALAYTLALLAVAVLVLWAGRHVVVLWVRVAVFALGVTCVVGWVRHWFGVAGRRRSAAYAMLGLAAYVVANAAVSLRVKAAAREAAVRRFGPQAQRAALTAVGRPFEWEPIYASRDTVAGSDWAMPRHLDQPTVQQTVRDTPEGRAMAHFARFLAAEVDSTGRGLTVYLRDARYERMARRGWGVVAIRLR